MAAAPLPEAENVLVTMLLHGGGPAFVVDLLSSIDAGLFTSAFAPSDVCTFTEGVSSPFPNFHVAKLTVVDMEPNSASPETADELSNEQRWATIVAWRAAKTSEDLISRAKALILSKCASPLGGESGSLDDDDYKDDEYFPVLLTLIRSDACDIELVPGTFVELKTHAAEEWNDPDTTPGLIGATFVGHVHVSEPGVVEVAMWIPTERVAFIEGWNDDFSVASPRITKVLERHSRRTTPEGVVFQDDAAPPALVASLREGIDKLAQRQESKEFPLSYVDFHPHSRGVVRDFVHPALYPFIEGVSWDDPRTCVHCGDSHKRSFVCKALRSLQGSGGASSSDDDRSFSGEKDAWGRRYEDSSFQWLPTDYEMRDDGRVKISDYINNLVPRSEHVALYSALGELFSHALPLLEAVWAFGRATRAQLRSVGERTQFTSKPKGEDLPQELPVAEAFESLRGRKLQVITKIVEYQLHAEEDPSTYEGVWHVEGMSHEEIVATALYILDRDEELVGADISFKVRFSLFARVIFTSRSSLIHPRLFFALFRSSAPSVATKQNSFFPTCVSVGRRRWNKRSRKAWRLWAKFQPLKGVCWCSPTATFIKWERCRGICDWQRSAGASMGRSTRTSFRGCSGGRCSRCCLPFSGSTRSVA